MKTIKTNLKSEAVYNDEETRRYSLHLEWQKDSKRACVIMLKARWTSPNGSEDKYPQWQKRQEEINNVRPQMALPSPNGSPQMAILMAP